MGHDVQPSVSRRARASEACWRLMLRQATAPSSSATHAAAKWGRRARMTGSASAQEAQYAAGLVRAADWSPNPPRVAGIPAISQAACASCSGAPPMQERKVSHRAASCAAA